MSNRGGYGGAGRGGGGPRSDQRQEQSSGAVAWPALQSSGGRGASVSGGRGRGNGGRGNTRDVTGDQKASSSSAPSDVVSGVSKEVGRKVPAVDVASSSSMSVQEKTKVSESDSASALSLDLAEKVQITPETTLPPASSKAVTHPLRPGFGQAGKKITVRANHFLVQVADRDLYHYDVSFFRFFLFLLFLLDDSTLVCPFSFGYLKYFRIYFTKFLRNLFRLTFCQFSVNPIRDPMNLVLVFLRLLFVFVIYFIKGLQQPFKEHDESAFCIWVSDLFLTSVVVSRMTLSGFEICFICLHHWVTGCNQS